MLLKNNRSLEKSEEIKKYLETNEKENKHNNSNSMGHNNSSCKKELYNNISLPQETRKISYKQPNLIPKELEKEKQIKSKVTRGKEIINIRAEINEIETKK